MRKIVLDVREIVVESGKEYYATSYPGPGLYCNTPTYEWFVVFNNLSSTCVTSIGKGTRCPIGGEDYVEPAALQPLEVQAGISADHILKAIAISQNPLLAKELLK